MREKFKRWLIALLFVPMIFTCGCDKEESQPQDEIIKIACIGDSLTQGVGATGWQDQNPTYTYPQQLWNILGDGYKVGNFGKGSSYVYYYEGRTENLWYPNTGEYTLSNQFDADIVIIMLGANDVRVMKNYADSANFKAQFIELVEHYLDLESKPQVYIVSTPTMALYDKDKEQKLKKYILPMQEEVAYEFNLPFIDVYNGLYEYFISGDGFASDNLHMNDDGYRKIAEYIAGQLNVN